MVIATTPAPTIEDFRKRWQRYNHCFPPVEEKVACLFEQLWRDLVINANKPQQRFNRSSATNTITIVGPNALNAVARFMLMFGDHLEGGKNLELFETSVHIITAIRDKGQLAHLPYTRGTSAQLMKKNVLIRYCLSQAQKQ